jgi:hypothetical protein
MMTFKDVLLGAVLAWTAAARSTGATELTASATQVTASHSTAAAMQSSVGAQWIGQMLHSHKPARSPVSEQTTWAMMGFGICLMAGGLCLMREPAPKTRLCAMATV